MAWPSKAIALLRPTRRSSFVSAAHLRSPFSSSLNPRPPRVLSSSSAPPLSRRRRNPSSPHLISPPLPSRRTDGGVLFTAWRGYTRPRVPPDPAAGENGEDDEVMQVEDAVEERGDEDAVEEQGDEDAVEEWDDADALEERGDEARTPLRTISSGTICMAISERDHICWSNDTRTVNATYMPFGDQVFQLGHFLVTDEAEKTYFLTDYIALCFSGEEPWPKRYIKFLEHQIKDNRDVSLMDIMEINKLPVLHHKGQATIMLMDRRLLRHNILLVNYKNGQLSQQIVKGLMKAIGVGEYGAWMQIRKLIDYNDHAMSFDQKLQSYLDGSVYDLKKLHGTAVLNAALDQPTCGGYCEIFTGSPTQKFKRIHRIPIVSLLKEYKNDFTNLKLPRLEPHKGYGDRFQKIASGYAFKFHEATNAKLPLQAQRHLIKAIPNTSNYTIFEYLTAGYVPELFHINLHDHTKEQQNLFASLDRSSNTSFAARLESLLSSAKPPQSGGLAKQGLYSVAQYVAVLSLALGDHKCASAVEMLKSILKDYSSTSYAKRQLALLCLGEIGRRKDLSMHSDIATTVMESFQSPFEEIKSAASYALGNIAVGNLSKYLPFILDQIGIQQKKQYLLLHSLKEVIARQSIGKAGRCELQDSNVEKILKLLFTHCESEEEGVRNVVAECLGKIALVEPWKLIPALKVRTSSPAAFTRATVVTAVKHSIIESPEKVDELLYHEIITFLKLIKDSDRHVRRAAVLALSTAAHNKPNLIKGLLPELLPFLYDQTVIKAELIRTVDLGPFKHTVDDGLELRKAAFECVETLLDSCCDQVNLTSFIVPHLISGLLDHYDVKMPCHLILSKLADKCPAAVLAVLDSLVTPLEKTINQKLKLDAVRQEVDRNEDMIRSAFRAIASLSRISLRFKMLMDNITSSASLAEKYNSVRAESGL